MISVVIPIHNEEPVLPQLLARLRSAAKSWGDTCELVFVDDGSTDGSLALLMAESRQDSQVRIVKLSRNFGHQAAISAGIRAANGTAVAVIDGDLQDPPELLAQFIAHWREGYEVVYGIRQQRKETFAMRFAYSLFYRALHMISDIDIPLDAGDFCLMDRKVVDALNCQLPEQVRFVRGLRAYVGFRQIGIPYDRSERAAGNPSYRLRDLVRLAVDGLFGFSMLPLRLASYFGFLIAIPSFLMGIYFIVIRTFGIYVLGHTPEETPGLATLAVGIFFLSGLILIILGIIGEYLGRIYIEVKRRPPYVIDYVFPAVPRANESPAMMSSENRAMIEPATSDTGR